MADGLLGVALDHEVSQPGNSLEICIGKRLALHVEPPLYDMYHSTCETAEPSTFSHSMPDCGQGWKLYDISSAWFQSHVGLIQVIQHY